MVLNSTDSVKRVGKMVLKGGPFRHHPLYKPSEIEGKVLKLTRTYYLIIFFIDDLKSKLKEVSDENQRIQTDKSQMVQDLVDARSTVKELGRTHAQIQV